MRQQAETQRQLLGLGAHIVQLTTDAQAMQQNTTAILDRMTECRLGQAGINHWLRTVKDFDGTRLQDFMEWMDSIERATEEANNPNLRSRDSRQGVQQP